MPPLTVMFKTVSSDCNLDCSYCYYRGSLSERGDRHRVSPELLRVFLPHYMEYVSDSHQATISWQGGEPTLAGPGFFHQVVTLEAEYARPPMAISNAVQTNGILIDDEWARFFATYNFLVGVSLDGPQAVHDAERKDLAGHGTFRRVMKGIESLIKNRVDTNILCVVGQHNVRKAGELVNFFTKEGFDYLQFMPAMAFQSTEPQSPASYLISPEEYGCFLEELFDHWYQDGVPTFSVRTFDNILQSLLGMQNDLCIHSSHCRGGLVIEYNGDVYPCDFYIHPAWKIGNILESSLEEIVKSPRFEEFSRQKQLLAGECRQCRFLNLCKGECPRNRTTGRGSPGTSYFCTSYKRLFSRVANRLNKLADRLKNYRRFLQWCNNDGATRRSNPGENDQCPCGSENSFVLCCGNPAIERSYLFKR